MILGQVLITGGAGFIGTHLAQALASMPDVEGIWILDNLHPQVHGDQAATPILSERVKFVLGDIRDAELLDRVLYDAKPEIIFHLAAETGTGQSYGEIVRYCDVNVTGTAQLLEAIRRSETPLKKLILSGSRAVYGEGAYRDADNREYAGLPRTQERMATGDFSVPLPVTAKLPAVPAPSHAGLGPAPASIYASTKLMQELLIRQAAEGTGWQAIILRFQNVYGPGQSLRNPYTGVLSIFGRQLLQGETLSIYEDGLISRDFIYVEDVVSALVLAAHSDLVAGAILDIGTGAPVTILEVARMLASYLGRDSDVLKITGEFRVGDIRHSWADIRAASTALGWRPKIDVSSGLCRLAEWIKTEFERKAKG